MAFYILIPIFLIIYWIITHNRLISLKNKTKLTFSGIDIQLKKRWNLIPQLVSVAKGYANHEKQLFESIIKARNAAQSPGVSDGDRFRNENIISEDTPKIIALAENYPELKANEQFLLLQRNLTEIESQISASRRSYNAAVLQYNNLIESFPSSMIASNADHQVADFFNIETTERNNVSAS